jgi:predicted aspartyl protease
MILLSRLPLSLPLLSLPMLCGLALSAQAADAPPACSYVPVATLLMHAASKPTVDGTIDGKPAVMQIDTGATQSGLMLPAVEKFGLRMDNTGKYEYGIGGAAVSYAAVVKDFSVGSAHSGKVALRVIGNASFKPSYDALIGADFIFQADLEISMAEKQLRFFRATGCEDTFLAYWDKDAMEIPFGGTASGTSNPRFMVELNGVKLEALIDTGASLSVVSREAAARAGVMVGAAGVAPAGKVAGIGAATVDSWNAAFETFTIGEETIKNAAITILDTPRQGGASGFPDVLLGADFLRAHRVLFAMSQRRLYISYTGGTVFAPPRPVPPSKKEPS